MRQLLVVIALTGTATAESYVAIGAPTFTGSLDSKHADEIDVMVKNHRDEYVKCYDPALGEVRVHVTLIVHPTGRVTGAGVATAKGTNPVTVCVQSVLKDLRFDWQAQKLTIDYAFVFQPTTPDTLDAGRRVEVDDQGNVVGTNDTPAVGGFGYGRSGFGPGGTHTGWGHEPRTEDSKVTLGEPTVTGTFDKAIVRRYVKRNLNKIQYCYEKNRPDLGGNLTATFKIGEDGVVLGMHTAGFDRDVSVCVEGVLKDIEFPRPKAGSVDVKVPIAFSHDRKKK